MAAYLLLLFRWILDDRLIADINLLSFIVPLLNADKDLSKPGSYRPVTLTKFFIWVLENVLKTKLMEHTESLRLLSPGQHKFHCNLIMLKEESEQSKYVERSDQI